MPNTNNIIEKLELLNARFIDYLQPNYFNERTKDLTETAKINLLIEFITIFDINTGENILLQLHMVKDYILTSFNQNLFYQDSLANQTFIILNMLIETQKSINNLLAINPYISLYPSLFANEIRNNNNYQSSQKSFPYEKYTTSYTTTYCPSSLVNPDYSSASTLSLHYPSVSLSKNNNQNNSRNMEKTNTNTENNFFYLPMINNNILPENVMQSTNNTDISLEIKKLLLDFIYSINSDPILSFDIFYQSAAFNDSLYSFLVKNKQAKNTSLTLIFQILIKALFMLHSTLDESPNLQLNEIYNSIKNDILQYTGNANETLPTNQFSEVFHVLNHIKMKLKTVANKLKSEQDSQLINSQKQHLIHTGILLDTLNVIFNSFNLNTIKLRSITFLHDVLIKTYMSLTTQEDLPQSFNWKDLCINAEIKPLDSLLEKRILNTNNQIQELNFNFQKTIEINETSRTSNTTQAGNFNSINIGIKPSPISYVDLLKGNNDKHLEDFINEFLPLSGGSNENTPVLQSNLNHQNNFAGTPYSSFNSKVSNESISLPQQDSISSNNFHWCEEDIDYIFTGKKNS